MSETEKLNLSELATRFNLDRATVAKRLADAAFTQGPKNSKLYEVEEVAELLTAAEDSPELERAKTRRAIADAEKAELIVAKLKGELVDRVAVMGEVQEIFSRLYQTIAVQYPRRHAGRLSKLSAQDLAKKMQADLMSVFNEIAEEYDFTESD
jgi:transcriptional regulator with XRE-family HTH domain